MITITYMTREKKQKPAFEISINGHAQSDVKGKDLVCCAVSTLIETLYAFFCLAQEDFSIELNEEGQIAAIKGRGIYAMHSFDQTLTGLKLLAKQYPDNVEVIHIRK